MSHLQAFAAALLASGATPPGGLRTWNGSDPAQRFRVYRNNVAVSLVDALADNFPVVQALVGDAVFRGMAHRFIVAHPPASPVLALYGIEFSDFIASFPPAAELSYLADVARLEWLYQNAAHGPDAPTLRAEHLAVALADPEHLNDLQLQLHPTAAPFHSPYAAISLWAAHQRDDSGEIATHIAAINLAQGESGVVVRQGLEVAVVPLPPCAVEFLTQLGAGVALGAAAHDAQATTPDFDLGQTLGLALRAGLFTDFKIATSPRDPHENPCTD
ncbi:MAG: putative DNA-binding domain-containing protein [Rhodocyclaceae bacterium]|nr:putative DNA-binding domain-containing protein [Rhodocyclaceae bacterium]